MPTGVTKTLLVWFIPFSHLLTVCFSKWHAPYGRVSFSLSVWSVPGIYFECCCDHLLKAKVRAKSKSQKQKPPLLPFTAIHSLTEITVCGEMGGQMMAPSLGTAFSVYPSVSAGNTDVLLLGMPKASAHLLALSWALLDFTVRVSAAFTLHTQLRVGCFATRGVQLNCRSEKTGSWFEDGKEHQRIKQSREECGSYRETAFASPQQTWGSVWCGLTGWQHHRWAAAALPLPLSANEHNRASVGQGGSENFSKCGLLGGLGSVSAGKELSLDSLEGPWERAWYCVMG